MITTSTSLGVHDDVGTAHTPNQTPEVEDIIRNRVEEVSRSNESEEIWNRVSRERSECGCQIQNHFYVFFFYVVSIHMIFTLCFLLTRSYLPQYEVVGVKFHLSFI